jgi:hypothetical protein
MILLRLTFRAKQIMREEIMERQYFVVCVSAAPCPLRFPVEA